MKTPRFIPGWNYVEYLLLRGLSSLINSLPIAASTKFARAIGDLLFFIMRKRRRTALDNLNLAFGETRSAEEKERIARETFRTLVISLIEFFRVSTFVKEAGERFQFSGIEYLDQARARGKGVILVISHLGSWEYLAFLAYLKGYPCHVIGKPMKNPYIYQWVQSLRGKAALHHIDKKNAIKPILTALRKNDVVGMLIDQWASGEGLWLEFFGTPTSTTSVPARLASKTGCALVPAYCLRTADGYYKIEIHPEVPVLDGDNWEQRTTLALNRLLEDQIRKYPEQWSWAHRRWKSRELYEKMLNRGKNV